MHRRFSLLVFCLILAPRLWATPLALEVTTKLITISNVTSGGSVVFFSCARVPASRSIDVRPSAAVYTDTAHTGVIKFKPAGGLLPRAVYVAVDQTNGAVAVAAAPGFPLLLAPLPAGSVQNDSSGHGVSVQMDVPYLTLLVVRPGTGAWQASGLDTEQLNRNPALSGRVDISFANAHTVGSTTQQLTSLNNGDVLAIIEQSHLDVFTSVVGQ
jgi:hypothetical protein